MIYKPEQIELNKAIVYVGQLFKAGKCIEIKPFEMTRSNQQNRALHLYFSMVSKQFNELGFTFNYHDPFTGQIIELTWTGEMIKEYIWKPIQLQLFDKKSTTAITTIEINQIVDILSKHFAENGSLVEFPNYQRFLNELDKRNYNE